MYINVLKAFRNQLREYNIRIVQFGRYITYVDLTYRASLLIE